MSRLWTDEQEAAYRATSRPGGRWSGGIYLPEVDDTAAERRKPGFFEEVLRAVRAIRHE